jgi:hypothetical protein
MVNKLFYSFALSITRGAIAERWDKCRRAARSQFSGCFFLENIFYGGQKMAFSSSLGLTKLVW